jgi:beta-1,4-mannosyl-glycoprotein beta-1,4-N-acetylglucosaminyltransferase
MKWLDTVMFNGEPILKARLEYLAPFVDRFYICEQRYTHQGVRKEKLFVEIYRDWLEPHMSKVCILIDERDYRQEKDTWVSENAQRNYSIPHILRDYPTEKFIVSVCDVDEIPDASVVLVKGPSLYETTTKGAVIMKQPLFYYNLNWYIGDWARAFFLSDITVKKYMDFQKIRSELGEVADKIQCGWHLSYFLYPEDIRRKIESFAHTEFNLEENKNLDHIRSCIRNGKDIHKQSSVRLQRMNIVHIVPEAIRQLHLELIKIQEAA